MRPPRSEASVACGDPQQLAELVARHQTGLFRYLRSLGCGAQEAEELAVETFAVAHAKRFAAPNHVALAAGLRRTAELLWLEAQRRQGRDQRRLLAAAEALWERTCARDDGQRRLQLLRQCVAELSGRAATAVQLFYREGLSRRAAAERLRMLPDGFKTLLQRTRAALRECIARKQGADQ